MRTKTVLSIVLGSWALASSALLVHCVGDGDQTHGDGGVDANTNDSGADVAQPPDAGFTLTLTPGHLTEDPGDSVQVTINVLRAPSFNDPVSFTVTTPPGLTATQPAPAGTTSTFYIGAGDAGAGDLQLTVTGASTTLVQNVKLDVHVGSMLPIGDGGAVVVPSFATVLDVKMWGGGGGAGAGGCSFQVDAGGAGGAGGYAVATVPVSAGTYTALVGGGGGYDPTCQGLGGGGGGYSALLGPDGGALLVAGGGGGSASVWFNNGGYGALSASGGGGGGASGEPGGGMCVGFGGAQDGGGAGYCGGGSGSAFQGGSGSGSGAAGGKPGGGAGGDHAGGGGGGYFGGGGAGTFTGAQPYQAGAGGGGCGYNPYNGGVLTSATGATPPNTSDPDYANGAGAAGFKVAGSPGRVVIRLAKP